MHRSINKNKIYFYLFILFFLSSIFNFSLVNNLKEFNSLKNIEIIGLKENEKKSLKNQLKVFLNQNIFFIDESLMLEKLKYFKYLDGVTIKKIFPSKLSIIVQKTKFLGITYIDGKKYIIGKNGKFIPSQQIENIYNLPLIFGKFSVSEFLILQNIFEQNQLDLKEINKYFYHKSKRWDLEFKNGLIIKLPSKNIKNSLEIYKSLVKNNKIKKINIIDLRIPNQIVLTNEEK